MASQCNMEGVTYDEPDGERRAGHEDLVDATVGRSLLVNKLAGIALA